MAGEESTVIMIQLDGVRVEVPGRCILSVDALNIAPNEVLGLMGPNGAGKSTLIQVIAGLLRPTQGSVRVQKDSRVGYLPERAQFPYFLTGREVMGFLSALSGLPNQKVNSAAERMGILKALDQSVRTYSKGMNQRLGLAQLWVEDSEIVLMDEPMSGLDPSGRKLVRSLIQEMKSAGKTVIFSSHMGVDFRDTCDRVLRVEEGRLFPLENVEELEW